MATKKVVVLSVLFSAFCVVVSSAQVTKTPPTPQTRAEKATVRMKKALNLNDEQAAKVEALNVKMFEAQMEMNKAMREAAKEFRTKVTSRNAEMQKILTPEQFKECQRMERHMRHHWQAMQQHWRHMQRPGYRTSNHWGNMRGPAHHMPYGMQCKNDSMQCMKGNMHPMNRHRTMQRDTTQTTN
ncbi:hypothetical protein [Microbacter margulisiae]|uniref:Spy/CpxP family protein refolding chaperone n=1 Tax=Microbacter margulisiae TaxID=1350067 RepID=A0A7W5H380_9PORP|nr:hypothetical protein [Microbacter margulisiae]MBB3188540.1 Spy/CpxP family protein refolding chaperone [Microbacter margulisiae]